MVGWGVEGVKNSTASPRREGGGKKDSGWGYCREQPPLGWVCLVPRVSAGNDPWTLNGESANSAKAASFCAPTEGTRYIAKEGSQGTQKEPQIYGRSGGSQSSLCPEQPVPYGAESMNSGVLLKRRGQKIKIKIINK